VKNDSIYYVSCKTMSLFVIKHLILYKKQKGENAYEEEMFVDFCGNYIGVSSGRNYIITKENRAI